MGSDDRLVRRCLPKGSRVIYAFRTRFPSALWLFAPLAAVMAGDVLVHHESRVRLLLLLLLLFGIFVLSTIDVRAAVVVVFAFLPFLAFARRLLISSTGWPLRDPLVLLGAGVVGILVARLFVLERR